MRAEPWKAWGRRRSARYRRCPRRGDIAPAAALAKRWRIYVFLATFATLIEMGVVEQRKQLFGRLVRLRRVARESPNNRDIVAVSGALADELGESVSQRLAAHLLGVSHSALARWIKTGDLPVVY